MRGRVHACEARPNRGWFPPTSETAPRDLTQTMHGIGILGVVLVGMLAGWIAKRVLNRRHGLFANLIVGLLGALLGGWIADGLEIQFGGFLGSLAVSTAGAVLLLAVLSLLRRR